MSVLVKGMKMPRSCTACPFVDLDNTVRFCRGLMFQQESKIFMVVADYMDSRPDCCPLIEIRGEGE